MYIVYALQFKDRTYVGMTSDLNRRLKEHGRGKTKSTKNRGEFTVLYIEECDSRVSARERERYWKSGCRKDKLKQLRTISSVG